MLYLYFFGLGTCAPKEKPAIAKNGSLPTKKEKQASSSDSFESSSEEDSSSDEEAPAKNKILVVPKKGSTLAAKTKKANSNSNSFDGNGFVEEEPTVILSTRCRRSSLIFLIFAFRF
ncbi:hypothetical protein PVK06_038646 [Gossypium arboreum]|uniref:Uncharacterized protein n=1 Tax=Gossypium arboreum TaxID=29729 RepID=A0ABR0N174_GOSAR|nr:hypothetical protein PVK06_038646 [Gossypium arboreum]